MKLSTFLLSVNIAASLPIVICQMAPAAEEGVADTGDWLKSNLASIKNTKGAAAPTSRLKVTMPEKISSGSKTFDAYVARLKPLNKVSKLPRQRDLDMQLVSQTPTMAADPNAPLSGNVSQAQYADYPAPQSFQRQAKSLASMVPKGLVSTQRLQAIAGQHRIGAVPSAKALKMAKKPEQSLENRMNEWLGAPNKQAGERMIGQAGACLVQAPAMMPNMPSISDAELQRQMAQASAMNGGGFAPAAPAPTQSASGPAPFPLNLVPEAQLKEFIRGGRNGTTPATTMGSGMGATPGMGMAPGMGMGMGAGTTRGMARAPHMPPPPKAFFGSWHGNGGAIAAAPNVSNLPKAGFRSNLKSNVVAMRSGKAKRYSKGPKLVAARAKGNVNQFRQAAAPVAHPPVVAHYGQYTSSFRAGTY